MSSQLTTLTLILDGTNYQQWSAAMQFFLMSQGQWKCVKGGATPPETITIEAADGTSRTEGEKEQSDWLEDAEKALGNIRLRLHHTIAYQYNDEESPSKLWGTLKEKYGTPGISHAYVEFKGMMDTVIPNNADPSPALDKIMAHNTRLKGMSFDIPDQVLAMIIVSKIPPSMEMIAQMTMIASKDATSANAGDPKKISELIRSSWDTTSRGKNNNQQRANKLSAVKPANQPPVFQQQQQQRVDWQQGRGGRGGTRRGKRGGRKNAQQQLQQAMVQSDAPGPSQLPPPPSQWVPAPSPYVPGPSPYTPGPVEWATLPPESVPAVPFL